MDLYLYSAFLVLVTTQSSLQYSFTFTQSHTHSYSASISSTLSVYKAQFGVQHLAQGHFDMQIWEDWGSNCRPSGWRTTTLPSQPQPPQGCGLIWLNTWNLTRPGHGKDWQIDSSFSFSESIVISCPANGGDLRVEPAPKGTPQRKPAGWSPHSHIPLVWMCTGPPCWRPLAHHSFIIKYLYTYQSFSFIHWFIHADRHILIFNFLWLFQICKFL